MLTTNVKELRAHLPHWLLQAQRGEEVTVLSRGKPVVKIVPIPTLGKSLPSLKEFRAHISVRGTPMSAVVVKERRRGF